jgi:hypothetical protein
MGVFVDPQFEMREIPRVLIEQAVGTRGVAVDIPVTVEDRKCVAIFQRTARPACGLRGRDIKRASGDVSLGKICTAVLEALHLLN